MALLSSARKATTLAPPLPVANRILNSAGIVLRRGQFSMLAAAPGVGKSLFANNLAVFTQVPSLFFSADSDEFTVKLRTISILTGHQLTLVDRNLNDEAWEQDYNRRLSAADHVDWCFQNDIDLEFLALRINAYGELRGEDPQLIFVDNLGNMVEDEGDRYAEFRHICKELQKMARNTRAHIMALHHVNGAKENGFSLIDLGDLDGKVGKIPEQVFGLSRIKDPDGEVRRLTFTAPKNRGGKGGISLELPIDYSTATFGGYR